MGEPTMLRRYGRSWQVTRCLFGDLDERGCHHQNAADRLELRDTPAASRKCAPAARSG
jgi:hypothetical protein